MEKEDMLRARQTDLEAKSQEKQREIERLEKMLELVRHDCNAQINEKVFFIVIFLVSLTFILHDNLKNKSDTNYRQLIMHCIDLPARTSNVVSYNYIVSATHS